MNSPEGSSQTDARIHIDSLGKLHAAEELGQLQQKLDQEKHKFPSLQVIVDRCRTLLDQVKQFDFSTADVKTYQETKTSLTQAIETLQLPPEQLTPNQILKAEGAIRLVAKLALPRVDHIELLAMVQQISQLTHYWDKVKGQNEVATSQAKLSKFTVS